MKIFLTSPGRRVELVKILKKELKDIEIIGGDYSNTSPALLFCDKTYKLPYKIDELYLNRVIEIAKKESVDIVIPLIDYELELYSKNANIFRENGIEVMISSIDSLELSSNKLNTFNFFKNLEFIKTPNTLLLKNYNQESFSSKYIILKPKNGSNSIGVYKIKKENVIDFANMLELDKSIYIAQEYIDFDFEVTCDTFIDKDNNLIELCQRKRLKVRGGEVERAVTIKDKNITKIIENIIEITSFFGVINIQIMVKGSDYYIGEINPRFGGGFPLSYYSGANMLEHINALIDSKKLKQYLDSRYKSGYYMLRFDDAIYTDELGND